MFYNLMHRGDCWPETAGYEHVVEYFADGVGFLETEAPRVGRGLLLMFKGQHGCCALHDGKTSYWGKWNPYDLLVGLNESIIPKYGPVRFSNLQHDENGEIINQHLAPEFAEPVALPVGNTGQVLGAVKRHDFEPPSEVVFGIVSSPDDLKAFADINRVAKYIRPGVRYRLVEMGTKGQGLMLRFWGEHACFVEPGAPVRWGQWSDMENALRIGVGEYICADDGSRAYCESLLNQHTGLFVADTTNPYPDFKAAIPTFQKAPHLWQALLTNLRDPNFN